MLKSAVAVITGAVSGLGRQTLAHLCNESAFVVGCDLRDDGGEIKKTFGDRAEFLKADVASEQEMENVFNKAVDKFGRLDILVNCAAVHAAHVTVTTKAEPFHLNSFTRMMETNICGQFNACRLAALKMAENSPSDDGSRGTIIMTSGFASKAGRRGQSGIGACYGAVESMTLPMARDLGPLGIRVATISPGFFETPLTQEIKDDILEYFLRTQAYPHRFGKPKEYSDLVLHIISNKMINGEVVCIDGGLILPGY